MTDVGTTDRKPLTPRQRLKLFEDHKGVCALCKQPIKVGDPWVDEHMRALGLGGSNAPDNRAPVHKACADLKTHGATGDLAKIAKAKRVKQRHLGIEDSSKRKLPSRGFAKAEKEPKGSRARIDKSIFAPLENQSHVARMYRASQEAREK